MKSYRKITQKAIKKQVCLICHNHSLRLYIHHVDGNHKNNSKKNLIPVCNKDRSRIHKGLTSKDYDTKRGWKENIWFFRKILLKKKYKWNYKKIEDRFEYEMLMSSRGGYKYRRKNVCLVCSLDIKDSDIFIPHCIKRFEPRLRKQIKYRIPICKKCRKKL